MTINSPFLIKSTIELIFNEIKLTDISYNSFLPEFKKLQTKRSKVKIEKTNNSLRFFIECQDITAFRATVSDIIGFGKILNSSFELCNQ